MADACGALSARQLAEVERSAEPEPSLVMFGCNPLVPYHGHAEWDGRPPFHAPETIRAVDPTDIPAVKDQDGDTIVKRKRPVHARNWPAETCPNCKGLTLKRKDHHCGWCGSRTEAQRDEIEKAEGLGRYAPDPLVPESIRLDEASRREIARTAEGRRWLAKIDQMPTEDGPIERIEDEPWSEDVMDLPRAGRNGNVRHSGGPRVLVFSELG